MNLKLLVNDNVIERPLKESLIYSTLQNNLNKKIKTLYMANSSRVKDAINLPDALLIDDSKYECILTKNNLNTRKGRQQLLQTYMRSEVFKRFPEVYELNLKTLLLVLSQECKSENKSVLSVLWKLGIICQKYPDEISNILANISSDGLADDEQQLISKLLNDVGKKNNNIITDPVRFLIQIHLDHINNKAQELNIIEDRHTLFVMHNKANSDYDSLLFQYMLQSYYAIIIDTEAQDGYVEMAMKALEKDLYIFTTDLSTKAWKSVALNNTDKFVQSANSESYKLFFSFVNAKNNDVLKNITFGQWNKLIKNQSLSLSMSSYLTLNNDKLERISMNNGEIETNELEFDNSESKIDEKEMLLKSISNKLDTLTQKLEIEENTSEDDDDNDLSFWRGTGELDSQTYRDTMISELENAKN